MANIDLVIVLCGVDAFLAKGIAAELTIAQNMSLRECKGHAHFNATYMRLSVGWRSKGSAHAASTMTFKLNVRTVRPNMNISRC